MDALEMLEWRMSALEQKLGVGADGKRSAVMADLRAVEAQLNNKTGKRPTLVQALAKLPEIRRLTDHRMAEKDGLSLDAKLKLIECGSAEVEQRAEQLAMLKEGEAVLDSEHIKHVSDLETSIDSIGSKIADQVETVEQHQAEVSDLIRIYNEMITDVSRQVIYWDSLLTKAEQQKAKS